MYNKKALLLSACVFVIAVSIACILAFIPKDEPKPSDSKKNPDPTPGSSDFSTSDYSYKIDIAAFAPSLNTTEEKYLSVYNKVHLIGEDFNPGTLKELDKSITLSGKSISLEEKTAAAAAALIAEMRACGFSGIYVTSGYRSFAYQKQLYNLYFSEEKSNHPTWSDEQIKNEVLTYSAYPGTSEHQSGLCMDLFVYPGMTELVNYGNETSSSGDKGFAETEEYKWLQQNAHKFGFILRYPEDKTKVTGYSYESWHYRFVGVSAATKIYNEGKTLEEYTGTN